MSDKVQHRIYLDFESGKKLDDFLAWLSNSGEQDYMSMFDMFDMVSDVSEEEINYPNFDYSKAFSAWGYVPAEHGHPTVKITFGQ